MKKIGTCDKCFWWMEVQGAYSGWHCTSDDADNVAVMRYPFNPKKYGCWYWKNNDY